MKVYLKNVDEKDVKAVVLYPGTDSVLYHDEELTVGVAKDEMSEIFFLGAVVDAEGALTSITGFSAGDADYATVTAGSDTYYTAEYVPAESSPAESSET